MYKISQEDIERVRDLSDIVDVISQYVQLIRKGNNFFGLCPFHNEKTPSFSVAHQKQIFHCFGCGKGGNVFSFLMDYQKISFPESVKLLADKYNVDIKKIAKTSKTEKYSILYELHEVAEDLYQKNLFSKKGKLALNYLKERGLTIDTIKKYKIGLSFNMWDDLVKKCKGKGYRRKYIEESGLFIKSKKGVFDRFRSRIMFPIHHLNGKTVGFGGRIFGSDDTSKYMNSPETIIYKKSDILYGLNFSRSAILRYNYTILVEGYMDLIQMTQAGVEPVVAVSGTAFTERHALALKRVTKNVLLLYDADSAGGKAIIKAGWMLFKTGLYPSVILPPSGKDPDDWVRDEGIETVKASIEDPLDYCSFHLSFYNAKNLTGAEREEYILDLSKNLVNIDNKIIRNDLIRVFSQNLILEEKELINLINKNKTKSITNVGLDSEQDKSSFSSQVDKAQFELVKLLLNENSSIRQYVKDKVSTDLFQNPVLKNIAESAIQVSENNFSKIIENIPDNEEKGTIIKILMEDLGNVDAEEIVSDCLKILISAPIKEKIKALRVNIKEKELRGEDPSIDIFSLEKYRKKLNEF